MSTITFSYVNPETKKLEEITIPAKDMTQMIIETEGSNNVTTVSVFEESLIIRNTSGIMKIVPLSAFEIRIY